MMASQETSFLLTPFQQGEVVDPETLMLTLGNEIPGPTQMKSQLRQGFVDGGSGTGDHQ